MKKVIFIILTFASFLVKGQMTWEFTNKLYIVDSAGKIDSVLFGNDSSATIGVDTLLGEQNIISISWDSLEIRSIHRTTDSIDCPIFYWGSIFESNIDLKKDIRKSKNWLDSSIIFVFKINAVNFPIDVYSDFSDMYTHSWYNSWTVILKHHYQCLYDNAVNCVPNYQHIFTISDSTERYITVRLDYETGVDELTNDNHEIVFDNPVHNLLQLDYTGRIQLYEMCGRLILDQGINKNEPINVEYLKPGLYFIRTMTQTIKIIKL